MNGIPNIETSENPDVLTGGSFGSTIIGGGETVQVVGDLNISGTLTVAGTGVLAGLILGPVTVVGASTSPGTLVGQIRCVTDAFATGFIGTVAFWDGTDWIDPRTGAAVTD